MRKTYFLGVGIAFLALLCKAASVEAGDEVRTKVTIITASNQGTDFNLVNDDYRDQLLNLFSYSHYEEINTELVLLSRSERSKIELLNGYELILTLQGEEKGRVLIQAVIRKDQKQYLDTVVSILKPGVVFVGGPPVENGKVLIIVLETGF